MGRTFSLRGDYAMTDNALPGQKLLLDYVSPDRTKAWRVVEAYMWPSDLRATIEEDGRSVLQATLWTDNASINRWEDSFTAVDNRQCGWLIDHYMVRKNGTNFITPNNGGKDGRMFIIDPDVLVTKELYLSAAFTTESAVSPSRDWSYLIVLEEIKVSPSQSLFQQIKGMGQDV